MKKLVFVLFLALGVSYWGWGQTPVGAGQTYTTLKSAFDAINSGTLTGTIVLQLVSSTTETASAVLNATGGSASYTSVTIYPTGSGYSISGSIAGALIQLNGASNVTIDGRVNQTGTLKDLTLINTNTGGQTLVYINDAITNLVKYCIIRGVNSTASSGVVVFSTSTGTLGNSSNTIDNCDIRDGATTPANLVYSSGTAGILNSNNIISNCNLFNWFLSTTSSTGAVFLTTASSAWNITGNSFYQTASRTYSNATSNVVSAIYINNTASGQNFSITGNFIGGSSPNCGGGPMTLTATTGVPVYRLIYFTSFVGIPSLIQGNTIANISLTSATTSTALSLISHINGNIQIYNNTFGSQSSTSNITLTLNNTSSAPFFMVLNSGTGGTASSIDFSGNNIGGITVSNSSTGIISFRIVYSQAVVGSTIKIENNIIGGSVANSMQQNTSNLFSGILILNPTTGNIINNNIIRNLTRNSTGVAGALTGINVQSSGNHTITNNQIYNLTTNTTNVVINNAASIVGIAMTAFATGGTTVSGNTIYNLTNTNTTVAGWINGMYFGTAAAPQPQTVISKNLIYGINLASATAGMCGIFVPNTGNALVYNNQIRLGLDAAGNSITTPLAIYGIWKASSANVGVYYNSLYIGGSGVTGAVPTVAYYRSVSGSADTVMNNILYNGRSNGSGTGTHYGIYLLATTALVSNYNDVYADGIGGALGSDNAFIYTTLPSWQTGTGLDPNSISANPLYVSSTNLMLQNASPAIGMANPLPQVTQDYSGNPRGSVTTMGAYELVSPTSPGSLTWTGAMNNNWHNPYNWNGSSTLPNATTDVTIPAGLTNYPTVANNGACNNMFFGSSASGTATILDKGNLTINGLATIERYFSGNDPDYHLFSSPVVTATAEPFLGMYLMNFDPLPSAPYGSGNDWGYTDIVDPLTALNVMEGYALYSDQATNTVSFTGSLNIGNQSHSFNLNGNNPYGWNLLGNPYPSSIDWDLVTIPPEMNAEVHYIDASTGADIEYIAGGGGGAGSGRYTPPMQGFFVSAISAGTLQLTNACRTHTDAGTYYKSDNNLLVLEASGNGFANKTQIYFNGESTNEHDRLYDAYKIITSSNPLLPQLYSVTPTGVKLGINGLPETDLVPVGMIAGNPGEFTISAVETSNFENVVLEDLVMGIKTNLLTDSYTFTTGLNEPENRFIVHFTPMAVFETGEEVFNIWGSDNEIRVNAPAGINGLIKVYNVMGQEISTSSVSGNTTTISVKNSAYYIVRVMADNLVINKKVFVK